MMGMDCSPLQDTSGERGWFAAVRRDALLAAFPSGPRGRTRTGASALGRKLTLVRTLTWARTLT